MMNREEALMDLKDLDDQNHQNWVLVIKHEGVFHLIHYASDYDAAIVAEELENNSVGEDSFDEMLEKGAKLAVVRAPDFIPDEHNGGINWTQVQQAVEEDDEGRFFLGSVFSIMPSRKYYMPWATGNVKDCPICKGVGFIDNIFADIEVNQTASRLRNALTKRYVDANILFGDWAPPDQTLAGKLDLQMRQSHHNTQCPYCGGIGSREVSCDQIYWEWLEEEAAKFGAWIETGEGDPCDIFISNKGEEEDDDEEDPEDEDEEE